MYSLRTAYDLYKIQCFHSIFRVSIFSSFKEVQNMLSYIPSRLKLSTYSFPLFLPQQRFDFGF